VEHSQFRFFGFSKTKDFSKVTIEEHCQQSIEYFGEPFEEVHRWRHDLARQVVSDLVNSPAHHN